MQVPGKTKEERIDEVVDDLVKAGRLLYISTNENNQASSLVYCVKIGLYREELKQLLKEEDANKQHT